jgi:hypothetical protein
MHMRQSSSSSSSSMSSTQGLVRSCDVSSQQPARWQHVGPRLMDWGGQAHEPVQQCLPGWQSCSLAPSHLVSADAPGAHYQGGPVNGVQLVAGMGLSCKAQIYHSCLCLVLPAGLCVACATATVPSTSTKSLSGSVALPLTVLLHESGL